MFKKRINGLSVSIFISLVLPQVSWSAEPAKRAPAGVTTTAATPVATPAAASASATAPTAPKGACTPLDVRWQSTKNQANCCRGLVPTSEYHFRHPTLNCKMQPAKGINRGYCVKCGDGKCDKAHFESECNCPKDCS